MPIEPSPIGLHAARGHIRLGSSNVGESEPFHVKGINWSGFESDAAALGGLALRELDSLLAFLALHEFNAIRFPLCVEHVLANPTPARDAVDATLNPTLFGLAYLDLLDAVCAAAASHGLLILLDMHRLGSGPNEHGSTKLWYDATFTVSHVKAAWESLASRFCSHWNLFAVDVFNEPYASSWARGNILTDWQLGAAELGDAVLGICPRLLVFVSGAGEASISCNLECNATLSTPAACVGTYIDYSHSPLCTAWPAQSSTNHYWGGNLEGIASVAPPGE